MSDTTIETTSLPIPITQKARDRARQFSTEQPNRYRAKRVYLNTLAVWAVRDYLQLMEIETNLEASDSWNPLVRMCADVADLKIEGVGTLECRPVKALGIAAPTSEKITRHSKTSRVCTIPPEVQTDRVGYAIVEIDDANSTATLLGFVKTAGNGTISLTQLESLDGLLAHLDRVRQPEIQLNRWLRKQFESEWQDAESLLLREVEPDRVPDRHQTRSNWDRWMQALMGDRHPISQKTSTAPGDASGLVFRSPGRVTRLVPEAQVARAKLVDFGMQLGDRAIALLVALTQDPDRKVGIWVQVHPMRGARYLPPNLKLALLSDTGETLQDVVSEDLDLYIQLRPFKALPQTHFSLQVALDDLSLTEAFAI
ncbi:DUF1822 family protein [Zarconia navalis]|nr:DUF1822 family protein [Zarconia navalis]